MKTRPILFSAPMVRALLAGTKTQTRRLYKGPIEHINEGEQFWINTPLGVRGDRLWVKETWAAQNLKLRSVKPTQIPEDQRINYAADHTADDMDGLGPWRPSLFMRQWMSRITLEIVSIRLERLHAISEDDAEAEGVEWAPWHEGRVKVGGRVFGPAICAYKELWERIHGNDCWQINPWVWVIEFKRVEGGAA